MLVPLVFAAATQVQSQQSETSTPFGMQGAHVSAALGPAFEEPTLRGYLDAGFMMGVFKSSSQTTTSSQTTDTTQASMQTTVYSSSGFLVGPSIITGFGASPTSVVFELGYGQHALLLGQCITLGPLLRVDPKVEAGGSLRLAADFFLVQPGIRLNVTTEGSGELLFSLGFGRF